MKIGIDLHGVLDTYPEIFKPMLRIFRKAGIDYCIVSGPSAEKVEQELYKTGYGDEVHSIWIYSVVDYLTIKGVEFDMTDPENPWCDDNIWWDAKARICKEYKIDYLIDDSEKYRPAFDLIRARFIHVSEIVDNGNDN